MESCFEWVQSVGCTRWKSSGDWLYNNVNVLNAIEWYILKYSFNSEFYVVFFTQFLKIKYIQNFKKHLNGRL